MLFRRLRHDQNVVNVSYWYKKYVCIDARCGTCTELLVGRARNSSACSMDMIRNELKRNNIIEIDIETLSFHINICLREHLKLEHLSTAIVGKASENSRGVGLRALKVVTPRSKRKLTWSNA